MDKNQGQFSHILTYLKIWGGVDEISESIFRAGLRIQLLIYLCLGSDRQSGRLQTG